MPTVLDEAIVEGKVITLAQLGDTGIIQAPAEDKGITQASVEDKGITQEDEEDKGGAMGVVEALDISQDGLGEAAKVVQLRIVTPWSKESQSWRERRQDWRPSGDPVPPHLPSFPLPTPAEEIVGLDTTEL